MTQEEKQLLLKDLCARVPYRTFVCLNPGAYNKPETCILTGVHGEKVHLNVDSDPFRIDHIKPYLRPMSSMTENERDELEGIFREHDNPCTVDEDGCLCFYGGNDFLSPEDFEIYIDFCNQHHLDYRGLIEKGLALEAPEGMYK